MLRYQLIPKQYAAILNLQPMANIKPSLNESFKIFFKALSIFDQNNTAKPEIEASGNNNVTILSYVQQKQTTW